MQCNSVCCRAVRHVLSDACRRLTRVCMCRAVNPPIRTSDVSPPCWMLSAALISSSLVLPPPSSPPQSLFHAEHFCGQCPSELSAVAARPLRPRQPPLSALGPCGPPWLRLGLLILHPSTMRSLLESSWMKFGPAGRDSLDWSPGSSALPSTDRQAVSLSRCHHFNSFRNNSI